MVCAGNFSYALLDFWSPYHQNFRTLSKKTAVMFVCTVWYTSVQNCVRLIFGNNALLVWYHRSVTSGFIQLLIRFETTTSIRCIFAFILSVSDTNKKRVTHGKAFYYSETCSSYLQQKLVKLTRMVADLESLIRSYITWLIRRENGFQIKRSQSIYTWSEAYMIQILSPNQTSRDWILVVIISMAQDLGNILLLIPMTSL